MEQKSQKLSVEWVHVIYLPPHPSKITGTALNYVEIRLRRLTFHLRLAVLIAVRQRSSPLLVILTLVSYTKIYLV